MNALLSLPTAAVPGSPVDRIPPNSLEAEMALLGSILVDREIMPAVSEIVRPDDFYASLHESIYLALYSLYEAGKPLDKVALAEELRARGMLDKIGGLAYLTSLMDTVPTAASAEYYAKLVREKATLRGLIHAGTRITELGYESEEDVPAALDASEKLLQDVHRRGCGSTSGWNDLCVTAADIARDPPGEVVYDIEGVLESHEGPTLIFAEPGALKSWLALFIAAAIVQGAPFLGRATRQRPYALYVNLDAGKVAVQRRVALLGLDDEHFVVLSPDGWNEASFDALLASYPGAFVIIDCMADAFQPSPHEDRATATRVFLRRLRKVFEKHGCNGLLIDHANREGRYFDSVQRRAAVRGMWRIDRISTGDQPTNTIRVNCDKPGESEAFEPFLVEFSFSDGAVTIRDVEDVQRRAPGHRDELEAKLLEWGRLQPKPFSQNTAVKAVGGRAEDARIVIKALIERGAWSVAGEYRKHALYADVTSSRTRSDEVDQVDRVPSDLNFVPKSPYLGDEVRDTVVGTQSAGLHPMNDAAPGMRVLA